MALDFETFLGDAANFLPPDHVLAYDGEGLARGALRAGLFEPAGYPRAVLVFYHGGGASRRGYGGLADLIRHEEQTAVIVPDIRGHGASGGPRGYAPSPEAVWKDVDTIVAWAREEYPGAKIFVGGHSSGAGLALNWAARRRGGAQDIAGLVLLAPMLSGARSDFAKARLWVFLAFLFSGGRLAGEMPAVTFDYPPERIASGEVVAAYTAGMSLAVTPRDAAALIARVRAPVRILAPVHDELFHAEDQRLAAAGAPFDLVGGGHLTCLLPGATAIARFIGEQLDGHA